MRITFVSEKFLPDAPRQLDPVEAGHDQVCDYEVRPLTSHERQGLLAIFSFAYDDDRIRDRTEEGSDHLAVVGCVVGHDDGHRHRPAPSVELVASKLQPVCQTRLQPWRGLAVRGGSDREQFTYAIRASGKERTCARTEGAERLA
jgi:hypothetical protein